MILCHKYKFIFIKTSKTAGTSVEIALSKFCGENDIVTPTFHPPDEVLRNKLGHVKPQNYRLPINNSPDIHPLKLLAYQRSPAFTNHMSAKDIRRHVGEDIWNSYYKFCIVRNPWDRAASLYYWIMWCHRAKKSNLLSRIS